MEHYSDITFTFLLHKLVLLLVHDEQVKKHFITNYQNKLSQIIKSPVCSFSVIISVVNDLYTYLQAFLSA